MSKKPVVALVGAAGKMGVRIAPNLLNGDYEVLLCENGDEAKAKIIEQGYKVYDSEDAVREADITILAVPDIKMFAVSKALVPLVKPNSLILTLDPAAAYAGELTMRNDCTFVVVHPCHPPLFRQQETPEAQADLFGGKAGKQDLVIALVSGDEEKFDIAKKISIKMFAPIVNCFRITVEQMAILEPTLTEVVAFSAGYIMREAVYEAIKLGVPEDAAWGFMLGHLQMIFAILFKSSNPPSDAAKVALNYGLETIYKPNWRDVFKPEATKETVKKMLHPK